MRDEDYDDDGVENDWKKGWDAEGSEDRGDGWTFDGDKVPEYDPGLDPTNNPHNR